MQGTELKTAAHSLKTNNAVGRQEKLPLLWQHFLREVAPFVHVCMLSYCHRMFLQNHLTKQLLLIFNRFWLRLLARLNCYDFVNMCDCARSIASSISLS